LLKCINCNPVPLGPRSHSDEASQKFASLQNDSRVLIGSGDRVKRCLNDIQPRGLFGPRPRCVETSGNVIGQVFTNFVKKCRALFSINRSKTMPYMIGMLKPDRPHFTGKFGTRPVPISAFWRYRVSLQRKKCCQQIIGLDDESFSVAVRIEAKELFVANLSPRSLLFSEQVRLARLARSLSAQCR
jgi:hypothetical protein